MSRNYFFRFLFIVKCYEENCSKRQDKWRCKNQKPLEKDCNEFCHEFTHEGSHNDIYQIIRDCSKINERNASEIRKIVDKKGKYCTKSRNSRYCYCNQSLCNKKIKLPDKFEVV